MIALRVFLLAGLIAHKAVWEVLKRRSGEPAAARAPRPLRARLARAAKTVILLGIVAQTVTPQAWWGPLNIADPAPWVRIAGVALYSLGLAVALLGRIQLGTNWSDIEAAQVLQHQQVVERGIYRHVRHPIYVGDLLLLIGLELALTSWLVVGALALVPVVLRQAIQEERMLIRSLAGYAEYCQRTKRFLPGVI